MDAAVVKRCLLKRYVDVMLSCSEDVRTANVIACDTDGVDCLVLEREYVLIHSLRCFHSAVASNHGMSYRTVHTSSPYIITVH